MEAMESAPDMKHEAPARRDRVAWAERPLGRALLRGWRRRCPSCGGAPLMETYLRVRQRCPSCGEALHHHRADDLPAWGTILIVGHLMASSLLITEAAFAPPLWIYWSAWPAATLGLSLWLLPRLKGATVALQWARRLHGFGTDAAHAPMGERGGQGDTRAP